MVVLSQVLSIFILNVNEFNIVNKRQRIASYTKARPKYRNFKEAHFIYKDR
jgi:hypothetical protein